MAKENNFAHELGDSVTITASGETGKIIARAQYLHSNDQYYLRYKCADGRAVESWWGDDAIEELPF